MPRPVLTAAGALALLCLAPHATQGFTETLECGDAMALASKGPFTPGEWLRYPSIGDATEMLSARSGGKAHPAEAHAAKLAGTKAALGATKAELLARESLRYDIIANSTEPGSRSRFQVICYGKPEGSPVTFGDSVALRLLHRDEFLTDGHDGDLSDLYHSLSTNERDRNFATIARGVDVGHGHYAPPKQGAVFQFFDPASPSSRAQVSTNSTVVLRSSNLQTLTIEKPVLGLPFRRRAELRVLTADDLVLDKKGNKVNVTESAAGRVDWTSEEYSKAARTSYPGEATFLTRVLCATSGGKLCGGRGVCRRGRCDCLIEYDGMACELKRQFATCHLTGDPHVQTFDGRRFNVFSEGEYLAYYNPDAAAGVEEKSTESLTVTMRKAASGITSSVASAVVRSRGVAVAVAADGQVTVDCGSTIAKKVRRRGGHGLAIKGSDLRIRWQPKARRWRISSGASGLVVWVESFGWGVNVWARTFQVPRGVSTGLCGNYNGDMGDDLGPTDFKLQKHFQPSEHLLHELTIPPAVSIASCKGDKLSFGGAASDMVAMRAAGDPIVAGEYKYGKAATDEEKSALREQAKELLTDADDLCGNASRRREAHRKCECRGFNKIEEFHLFADCVLDICETLDDEFVAADCAAEQGDADEAARITDYQLELDRMEIEQERHLAARGH